MKVCFEIHILTQCVMQRCKFSWDDILWINRFTSITELYSRLKHQNYDNFYAITFSWSCSKWNISENRLFLTAGLQVGARHKHIVMVIIKRQMVNTDEIKTTSETLNVPPLNLKIKHKSKKSMFKGSEYVENLRWPLRR